MYFLFELNVFVNNKCKVEVVDNILICLENEVVWDWSIMNMDMILVFVMKNIVDVF